MNMAALAPGQRIWGATVLGLLVVAAMLWLALDRPWLGLRLVWNASTQAAVVQAHRGPGQDIPLGTAMVRISGAGLTQDLEADDFQVEPDGNLRTYAQYRRFLARQGELAAVQNASVVTFTDQQGQLFSIQPAPQRPVSTLPPDFWVQILVAFVAWMIASAVWAFRPGRVAARYLLANGATTLMFSSGAAVYTTRELAIPFNELVLLKVMNFGGGLMFCATLVALMLNYPRRIAWPWLGPVVILAYVLWYLAQALGAFDSMMLGRRVPVFAALLTITGLALAQWLRARRDPIARASLRWFLLFWVIGMSLFVMLIMVPQIIEIDTGALQGYSFLLFLFIYMGIALGVLRYRLFDLGIWWFRALAWIIGALALIFLDLVFLLGMQLSSGWSLSLSLLVCALLWLPFRNWLWGRVVFRQPRSQDLFRSVVQVALSPTEAERTERWRSLLRSLFDPLHIRSAPPQDTVTLEGDGIALTMPAAARSPALQLQYPGQGRRLFSSQDLELARELSAMLAYTEESREAYAQGARAERGRIARDLHDDLGAILLTGLYQPDVHKARESLVEAMHEVRVILRGLTGASHPLAVVQADLRHELAERLEAAGLALDWQASSEPAESGDLADEDEGPLLSYTVYKNLVSTLRELISNIIRHAQASRVRIEMTHRAQALDVRVMDDGTGFEWHAQKRRGHGLHSLASRIENLGGQLQWESAPQGCTVRLTIPLNIQTTTDPRHD